MLQMLFVACGVCGVKLGCVFLGLNSEDCSRGAEAGSGGIALSGLQVF